MTKDNRIEKAQGELEVCRAEYGRLLEAFQLQQKRVKDLEAASIRDLQGANLDDLLDPKALQVAALAQAQKQQSAQVLSELERRLGTSAVAVRNAEAKVSKAKAEIVAIQVWEVESELLGLLEAANDKIKQIKQAHHDISLLIGTTRQGAYYLAMSDVLDSNIEEFHRHRKNYRRAEDTI